MVKVDVPSKVLFSVKKLKKKKKERVKDRIVFVDCLRIRIRDAF